MQHLNKLVIKDFMGIEALTIDAQGKHIQVKGPNGSGKTTICNSFLCAMGIVKPRFLPEAIRKGQKKAEVAVHFDDYTVEASWTPSTTTMVVKGKDGNKIKSSTALMESLIAKYAVDATAFQVLRETDKIDQVLSICGIKAPVEAVKNIAANTGMDVGLREEESCHAYFSRLIGDNVGSIYMARRDANRELTTKTAAVANAEQTLKALGGPLRKEDLSGSTQSILGELEIVAQQMAEYRKRQNAIQTSRSDYEEAAGRLQALKDKRTDLAKEADRLRARLTEVEGELLTLEGRITKGDGIVANLLKDSNEAAKTIGTITDPAHRDKELRVKLANVQLSNEAQFKRKMATEELGKLKAEEHKAEQEHQKLDYVIEQLRGLRSSLLDNIDIGVPGLSVGENELRLNGVPFIQESRANCTLAVLALAMKQNPPVKLFRVDNCESLDPKHVKQMLDMADEGGWQVFYTTVTADEEVSFQLIEPIGNEDEPEQEDTISGEELFPEPSEPHGY